MPLFETHLNKEEKLTNPNKLSADQPQSTNNSLITTIGQLLPLAPFVYEQFTGQKVPQMSGTIAEMQMTLNQIASQQQVMITNQQSLNQRLVALESTANQHLSNLTHQFNSLKLTHTQEKKSIEFSNPPSKETEPNY
jgi:hypothetical protein